MNKIFECKMRIQKMVNMTTTSESINCVFPMDSKSLSDLLNQHKDETNSCVYVNALKWGDHSYHFQEMAMDTMELKHFPALNDFTSEILRLSDQQRLALSGLFISLQNSADLADKDFYAPTLAEGKMLIDFIGDIDILHISNAKDLGKHLVENDTAYGLNQLTDQQKEYLDYRKIGQEFAEENNGLFIENKFVYNIPTYTEIGITPPEINESGMSMDM